MAIWICVACGLEHPSSSEPPARCAICEDERQYVAPLGQKWTTSTELERAGTSAAVVELNPACTGSR